MRIDVRHLGVTALALGAFAGNSVLCRVALGRGSIDAATFSTLRLMAGAGMLVLLTAGPHVPTVRSAGSWMSAAALFLYAVPFSFAYISLTTGTGALILFGSVQVTMMVAAIWSGERPRFVQWLGLAIALLGLVYLVFPGLAAPSPIGSALMTIAGVSWGIYSLRGRAIADPLAATAGNFVRAVPLALAVSLFAWTDVVVSWSGVLLAVASGAVTSGLGYVLWYAALRQLTAARAAVVQLTVPVLAAAGGVLFLGESISSRLVLSAAIVLGGISLALAGKITS
jgi:drug/metabolite transporter (DMT)-like permease